MINFSFKKIIALYFKFYFDLDLIGVKKVIIIGFFFVFVFFISEGLAFVFLFLEN